MDHCLHAWSCLCDGICMQSPVFSIWMVNSCNVVLYGLMFPRHVTKQDDLKGSTQHYSCFGLQLHIYSILNPFLAGCFVSIFVLIDSVAASHLCTCRPHVLFWPRQQCTAVLKVRMSKSTLVLLDESNA
jgi:hypothetical protein